MFTIIHGTSNEEYRWNCDNYRSGCMKFARHLFFSTVPEWANQYLQYKYLKKVINQARERPTNRILGRQALENPSIVIPEDLTTGLQAGEMDFFRLLYRELDKVNCFYLKTLEELLHKYHALEAQVKQTFVPSAAITLSSAQRRQLQNTVKSTFFNLYRELTMLSNFCSTNAEGFRKIVKKFDKNCDRCTSSAFHDHLTRQPHYQMAALRSLVNDVEIYYATLFTHRNVKAAGSELRFIRRDLEDDEMAVLKTGVYSGGSCMLLCSCVVSMATGRIISGPDEIVEILAVYRGLFMIILLGILFACNTCIWHRHRINYALILDVDPQTPINFRHIFEFASGLLLVYAINLYVFIRKAEGSWSWVSLPPHVLGLISVCSLVVVCVYPFKGLCQVQRTGLVRTIGRCVLAGVYRVEFRDFFLADQLTSLVIPMQDVLLITCQFQRDSTAAEGLCGGKVVAFFLFVAIFPSWMRLLQCLRRFRDTHDAFPHMVNGGKYFFSICTSITSAMRGRGEGYSILFFVWIFFAIISTSYSYWWDIRMDWGLGDFRRKQILRQHLVYRSTWLYYFATASNGIARLLWILTVSWSESRTNMFRGVLSTVEILRRFQWNMYRMENEHKNNCLNYRAVKYSDAFNQYVRNEEVSSIESPAISNQAPRILSEANSPSKSAGLSSISLIHTGQADQADQSPPFGIHHARAGKSGRIIRRASMLLDTNISMGIQRSSPRIIQTPASCTSVVASVDGPVPGSIQAHSPGELISAQEIPEELLSPEEAFDLERIPIDYVHNAENDIIPSSFHHRPSFAVMVEMYALNDMAAEGEENIQADDSRTSGPEEDVAGDTEEKEESPDETVPTLSEIIQARRPVSYSESYA